MIIRVTRAKISEGKVEEFKEKIEQLWIPLLKTQDGLLGFYPGIDSQTREFLMISLWENLDALRAIGGEHWDKAQINVEELPLLEQIFISHYESFGQEQL